jgi:NADH dehydrogenase/NADH:ubiquinone oxidoreductase subunit G
MKSVQLKIDGKQVKAEENETILETARANDIHIPTLCHADGLEPYGACRLCMVEISKNDRTRLVAACVYPVEENLVVRTDTDEIRKIRRTILELIWPSVQGLAKEYGIERSRFSSENTECCLCGMCVRYCNEVTKLNASFFKGRGINREIGIIPELANECVYCQKCFPLCPAGWIVTHAGIS